MLLPMAETSTHHPRDGFGRKKLIELINALKPLGLNATIPEFVQALAPLCRGRWSIRVSATMLDAIIQDHRHQSLINHVITSGCKQNGYDTTYKDLYPEYVRACLESGIEPFKLKTFQNRALQRQARWERNLNKTPVSVG